MKFETTNLQSFFVKLSLFIYSYVLPFSDPWPFNPLRVSNIWMVPDIKLLLLTPKTFFAFGSLSKSDNLRNEKKIKKMH